MLVFVELFDQRDVQEITTVIYIRNNYPSRNRDDQCFAYSVTRDDQFFKLYELSRGKRIIINGL